MASRHLKKMKNLRTQKPEEDALEDADSSPDQSGNTNAFAFLEEVSHFHSHRFTFVR